MITDRYYYSQLSEREQKVYTRLYKGVVMLEKQITVPGSVSGKSVNRIYQALSDDNPYLYYFNQSRMDVGKSAVGTVFMPQYFCTREQIETYNERINEIVNRLVADLGLMDVDDAEKERRIHDYICANVEYDREGAAADAKVNRLIASHSIIGVFARGRGVCEGIAKATKLLFNTVNMGCIYVSGTSRKSSQGPHAWNLVKVNGSAYHLDMTWDVANSTQDSICYDYYNLPDEAIMQDHSDFSNIPKCSAWNENYFVKNGLFFYSRTNLEEYLDKAIDDGCRNLYFRLADEYRGQTKDHILSAQRFVLEKLSKDDAAQWKVNSSFNTKQRTGRIRITASI